MNSETLTQSPFRGSVRDEGRAPEEVDGGGKGGGEGRDNSQVRRKQRKRRLMSIRNRWSLQRRPTGR